MGNTDKSAKSESKKEKRERKLEKKTKKRSIEEEVDKPSTEAENTQASAPKHADFEELEIDLSAGVPLSKKQSRLLKKGKLDLERLAKKHPVPKPELTEEEKLAQEEEDKKKSKKSEFAVWIGNLSFDTTKEDLVRFIVGKTAHNGEDDSQLIKIEEADITRVNLPKKENKIKGFAYIDLPSAVHVTSVVALSESPLNGRKLLIKNANSFEGRPAAAVAPLSKNPPSRILFVGNLSFDTSEDNLEEHFRHCGEIVRIRMATFEDTGKCKGFAFIDFKDETGPTAALKSKLAKKLINRPLRLEYGEDRSKRNPNHIRKAEVQEGEVDDFAPNSNYEKPQRASSTPKKRVFRDDNHNHSNKRVKSSVALATAQRASAAIVPSSGKKITFD
ncbi:predicted protein [Scheffersomyces stipitis CBS 6054]|uniref:RRM domain-containing protein n=1 Tax=Scheffersomyces stipitis (strain ATCC 58785 / CBS 6054 / NBRC 10063 / NRRL Y-11545) TaxID=322104 RepID=A3LZJ7_PICST|nr:predicted protein [Scheffersomyces stipitis CBS 6054]ABN68172.2 predicted protein [Scheffersomyces stipitis CBS 6054]